MNTFLARCISQGVRNTCSSHFIIFGKYCTCTGIFSDQKYLQYFEVKTLSSKKWEYIISKSRQVKKENYREDNMFLPQMLGCNQEVNYAKN